MKWDTEITRLLGCRYPILEGALTGLGTKNGDFAALVSRTGAVGCLTAHSYREGEPLREAIRNLRATTEQPFMVNLSIGLATKIEELLAVCIEEQVPCIETSAFRPDAYAGRIKAAGITWIHKAAVVENILHAEKLGADAVVLVGLDGYGFKSIRQLPTFTAIAYAAQQIKVPLIAAGGIANGRTMLAALMAGAEAVYIGSAFMATAECPIADRIKQNMIKARPDHPAMIREMLAPPDLKAYVEVMSRRKDLPLNKWLMNLEKVMLKRQDEDFGDVEGRSEGDFLAAVSAGEDRPKGPFSFACGLIERVVPVAEFVQNMVSEAEQIMTDKVGRWGLNGSGKEGT
jgi:NADH:quinone reductase (non-electrogenic)